MLLPPSMLEKFRPFPCGHTGGPDLYSTCPVWGHLNFRTAPWAHSSSCPLDTPQSCLKHLQDVARAVPQSPPAQSRPPGGPRPSPLASQQPGTAPELTHLPFPTVMSPHSILCSAHTHHGFPAPLPATFLTPTQTHRPSWCEEAHVEQT